MAIEIVSFPIQNGGSFHSFLYVYQRVLSSFCSPVFFSGAPGETREEAPVLRRQRLRGHREGPRVAEAADLETPWETPWKNGDVTRKIW